MIELAVGLSLEPAPAATQRYAWIATSGGGKTYGCGRMVEQFAAANVPVLIVDTVGVWAALRLGKDGKKAGLPFAIVGGAHADVPLDLGRGGDLARFLVSSNASAVVDLSGHEPDEFASFVAQFCRRLLVALQSSRRPRMVVLDEAQDLAPEKGRKKEQDMVRAVSALIRKARNHLCGVTLLTQRPESTSKEVLNLASNVFIGMLHGSHERKAVEKWLTYKKASPEVAKALDEVMSLQPGEFFFWSPSWLKRFERVTILPKWTFDGSSTERLGEVDLTQVAPLNLGELRALFAPAEQEPEPHEEVAQAETAALFTRQLADAQTAANYLEEQNAALERRVQSLDADLEELGRLLGEQSRSYALLREQLLALVAGLPEPVTLPELVSSPLERARQSANGAPATPTRTVLSRNVWDEPPEALPARERRVAPTSTGSKLGTPELKVLGILAWQKGPIPKARLALLAVYSQSGGGFGNVLSRLRTGGLITGSSELAITPSGRAAVTTYRNGRAVPPSLPPAGQGLFDWWLQHERVDGTMRAILQALRSAGGRLSKTELALRAGRIAGKPNGFAADGGGFGNCLSRLRTLGLIFGKGSASIELVAELWTVRKLGTS